MLTSCYADMHIHIGRDIDQRPVKITGAKTLTLTNILKESSRNKGLQMIGIIDSQSPGVQKEIYQLIDEGLAIEKEDGGILFEQVTLILGAEIEVYDEHCQGPIHVLCYFPTLEAMRQFSYWLSERVKNIQLSSQRYYGSAKELQYKVKELKGIFIPAHVFTPFKSLYGKGVHTSLTEVFDEDLIDAIELGLSSDTNMADQIQELHRYTYLSNSDAHSLKKIAREYQEIVINEPSFKEFYEALHQVNGRSIRRNFGLSPELGKYYRSVCQHCLSPINKGITNCPTCDSHRIVKGVSERILELASEHKRPNRPPYIHQVPLDFIPSLGPKTLQKLLDHFGTEMNVLHHTTFDELVEVIPEKIAQSIILMREGKLSFSAGGGGKYGTIINK